MQYIPLRSHVIAFVECIDYEGKNGRNPPPEWRRGKIFSNAGRVLDDWFVKNFSLYNF